MYSLVRFCHLAAAGKFTGKELYPKLYMHSAWHRKSPISVPYVMISGSCAPGA